MSCSLSVVAYLGSKQNASILNGSQGSWARMLGESLEMLHMDFLSLMRSLSRFLMFGTNKRWYKRHIQCMGESLCGGSLTFGVATWVIVARMCFRFVIFAKVISFYMAYFRDETSQIPRCVYGYFCERMGNCCCL